MNIVVIYDSVFGNTEIAAETIANEMHATLINVNAPKIINFSEIDFVIVGSPTHAGKPTAEMQKFLNSMPRIDGKKFATFDTRSKMRWVKIFGFASDCMASILTAKGGILVNEPTGFYVNKKKGPLLDPEVDHIQSWANDLLNN